MKTTFFLTLLMAALWLPQPTCAAPADLSNLLQKALFEEEANQNLNAAIQNYQALIQQSEEQRKLVATAIFRLGECYRKQGRTNEAAAQYQQLLSNYSDQTTLVNLSRQNLVGLGRSVATTGSKSAFTASLAPSTEQVPVPSMEEKQIKEVETLLKDSPDLVNGVPNQEPWLNAAASGGKLKFAEFLLNNGADVDVRGNREMTPLLVAALAGQKAIVELLLAHGANVNARSVYGQTALHLAADNGNKAIAEILISHKADVNATTAANSGPMQSNGSGAWIEDWIQTTPLHRAAIKGQKSIAELLLQNGANVAAKDRPGCQPLHYAVLNNYMSIAQLLLAHKADINAASGFNNTGYTPLHFAIKNGSLEMAEFLLKNKANVNVSLEESQITPLHVAISKLNPAMVDLLLSYKANVTATNSNGLMPLHLLINQPGDATLRKKIFDSLVAAGADINAQVKNVIAYAPLHLAVQNRDELLFKALLEHKPNISLPAGAAWHPKTPLHLAAELPDATHLRMAEMLLAAGADVNAATDSRNRTPLFYAIDSGLRVSDNKPVPLESKQMIELLLKHKANVNVLDSSGKTSLALAKERRLPVKAPASQHPEIVEEVIQMLKDNGANEALDRLTLIDVTRRGVPMSHGFGRAYTNSWSQYTLGEVVAEALGYTSFLNYNTVNRGKFAFPDLANVKVTRWDMATGRAQEIPVNVASMLQSSNRVDDFPLQWGDSVEIPELDHNTTEIWKGLTPEEVLNLYQMLGREVTITVKGEAHRVPVFAKFAPASVPGNTDLKSYSFDLGPVLRASGLLRASSDTSRVKVIRKDPQSNTTREIVANIEKDPAIWLQNGDVIEVPETN